MTVLVFHVTTQLKCHVTFWLGPPHFDSAHYQVLGRGLVNVEIKCFDLTRYHVIDVLCRRGPLILSHDSAKFWVQRPCESANITFVFVT